METHADHLHKAPSQGCMHYFFEFLMLFLAVTLGFFVENQREHYIEHQRANEFAKSLVKDLQSDIDAIEGHAKTASIYMALADSLMELSQTRLEGRASSQFCFYARFMYWTASIVWNRSTFEQIKNSGSLRYFKNHDLLEKLMKYDAQVKLIEMEGLNHHVRGNMLVTQINQIIEPVYHQKLSRLYLTSYDTISRATIENVFPAHPESLENKRSEIRELLNMVVVQQRNLRRDIGKDWPEAKEMASELIGDLKKEYHLE